MIYSSIAGSSIYLVNTSTGEDNADDNIGLFEFLRGLVSEVSGVL